MSYVVRPNCNGKQELIGLTVDSSEVRLLDPDKFVGFNKSEDQLTEKLIVSGVCFNPNKAGLVSSLPGCPSSSSSSSSSSALISVDNDVPRSPSFSSPSFSSPSFLLPSFVSPFSFLLFPSLSSVLFPINVE